jgi:hypothetical protein
VKPAVRGSYDVIDGPRGDASMVSACSELLHAPDEG